VDLRAPMIFALFYIGLFVIGGLTGLYLSAMGRTSTCTTPISWLPTSTTSW
jgi:heme/copper-type cytochrome/quinol oxidase subunit 1